MKTRVRVKLMKLAYVVITTVHGEDESPTDLLPAERAMAQRAAEKELGSWTIEKVEVVK